MVLPSSRWRQTHRATEGPGPIAGRSTELMLLVLVGFIITCLYILASLGDKGRTPPSILPFFVFIFVLGAVAHLGIKKFAPRSSQVLLPLVALLNGLGYLEIARWDSKKASYQSVWIFISVLALFGVLHFVKRIRDLDRYRYLSLLAAAGLMLLPLVPHLGEKVNGARLWIHLGAFTFQPVEIAKLLLIAFFASYFSANKEILSQSQLRLGPLGIPALSAFFPIFVAWGFALLVLGTENDIGFAMLFFIVFFSLLWITTGRRIYVVLGAVLLASGGYLGQSAFHQIHQRFAIWLNPWTTTALDHGGNQLVQSWFALANGGLTGTGVGLGQAGRYVGEVTTDMMMSALGEELGWIGVVIVLSAILLIVGEGLRIAQKSGPSFNRVLATGLSLVLGFQTFVIAAGVFRILPLTGITLPFVAYGGSSLVANYIIVGLLLRLSDENQREKRGGELQRNQPLEPIQFKD